MDNLEQIREWCVAAWRKRGTGRALGLLLIVLDILVLPPLAVAAEHVARSAGYIDTPQQFRSFALLAGAAVLISNVALLAAWLRWRALPLFRNDQIGVIFVPHGQDGAEPLVVQLYEALVSDLRARGLSRIATVNLIPSGKSVANAREAHALMEKTHARLVIYGAVTVGNAGGEQIRGFQRISFTVRLPRLDAETYPALGVRLGEAMLGRRFAFADKDSFIEAATVTHNISQVARFFVGVALTVSGGRWRQAQPILASLMHDIAVAANPSPFSRRFRANVRECFEEALRQEYAELYETRIVDHITRPEADAAVARSVELIAQLKALSPNPERFLLADAIMHFHRGQLAEAGAAVAEARRRLPREESAPHLSAAFLALWQGRFGEAVDQYRRAERCGLAEPEMIVGVIRFLTVLADAHPDRPELRFAIAFVSDAFLDRELGVTEFQRFLAESEGDERRGIPRLRQTAATRLRRRARQQAAQPLFQ